jgi:DNA-binding NarL/FixJ family response regulator
LSETKLDEYAKQVQQRGLDPHDMLTNRERQVLQLAAEGTTSSRIAELLHISVRTVESHRANLLLKLGLHNQTELVRYAIQRGLIPPG